MVIPKNTGFRLFRNDFIFQTVYYIHFYKTVYVLNTPMNYSQNLCHLHYGNISRST